MTINLFGSDAVIGDFQLSNYGFILASFDGTGTSEEETGMNHETIEEYTGHDPVPKFLGDSWRSKLTPVATIIKDPRIYANRNDMYFTEHECREVLRQLTGFHGYKKMQLLSYELDEPLFFNIRVVNVKYKKVNGKTAGILLEMECDSPFAWSHEFHYTFHASPSSNIILFNHSDNLYDYLLPKVTIKADSGLSNLTITNISDQNRTTVFRSVSKGEVITMDSRHNTLSSSNPNRIVSNDFNMRFIRLVPNKNEFTVSHPVQISFGYVLPRKVGFL